MSASVGERARTGWLALDDRKPMYPALV